NQKLFALKEPVQLKKGDICELRNLNNNGQYRTEDLILLKNLFSQKTNKYEVRYLEATRPWQRDDVMRVTFTTTWSVVANLEYGTTEQLGTQVSSNEIPINNHRIYLKDLKEG